MSDGTVVEGIRFSIGVDAARLQEGLKQVSATATQVDNEFNGMAARWGGAIQGLITTAIAPLTGVFTAFKAISSYVSDVSEVAQMTGAYNQKLDEWRIKRAQLARVTKEDIAIYKAYKTAMTDFNIALGDVNSKLMRSFMPVMKLAVTGLQEFTKWINRNQDNIVRFLQVTAGTLTAIFLPAILKTSAAILTSPLTWLVGALGVLVLVIDDLTTYIQGGESALSGLWSVFGTGPEIMAALTNAFNVAKEVISVLWKPLAALAAGFAAFKIGAVLVQGFISVLTSLRAVMTALAANPLLIALTALIGLIIWITDAFNRAGGDWTKVWDLMKQDLVSFLNLFGGLGDYLAEALSEFTGFFDAVAGAIGSIVNFVISTFKLIWAYLSGAGDDVKASLIEGFSDAFAGLISAIWSLLAGAVKAGSELVLLALQGLLAIPGLVIKGIGALFSGLLTLAGRIGSLIQGLIQGVIEGIGKALAAGIGQAATFLMDLLTGIGKFLGRLITIVTGAVTGLAGEVAAAAGAIISAAFDAVSDIFAGIYGVISGAVKAVINIIAAIIATYLSAVQGVFDFISGLFGSSAEGAKAAVAAVSSYIDAAIDGFMSFIEGIGSQLSGAWDVMVTAFDKAFGTFKGSIAQVKAAFSRALDGIKSTFGGAFDTVKSKVLSVFTSIEGAFKAVYKGIKNVLSFIGIDVDKLAAGFADLPGSIANAFSSVVNTILGAFDSAMGAADAFFDALIGFLKELPAKIAAAFNIGDMISGATDKLKNMAGGAMDSVKSFFGMGASAANETVAAAAPALAEPGMMPPAVNTASVVNSTTQTNNDNRRSAKQQTVNNTVNINVPNGDSKAIMREAQKTFHAFNQGNNFVSASDYGNYNL